MRILIALPGLHKYSRGAEIAFISIANELAKAGDRVTLVGSGENRAETAYQLARSPSIGQESFKSFPFIPPFRSAYVYEELTFAAGLLQRYRPAEFDVTMTCSYPFTNWLLRRPTFRGARPKHIFVTQNGDWPAQANNSEYRFFGCDGLVCTNPDFYERNKDRWRCALIPNGVDVDRFRPGTAERQAFGLPPIGRIVLMVSALIPSKRVGAGIEAVSRLPDTHLVVAGDGPLRETIDAGASRLLPGRFTRLSLAPEQMPALYRSADVFLHLSEEESFGNVFVEALACGIPMVTHDSPRVRWIVGDEEFLVDTSDAAAIARQIELAANNASARRQARSEHAGRFSWKKIGSLYRDFLSRIASSRKVSGSG